jgi:hypothetical protein
VLDELSGVTRPPAPGWLPPTVSAVLTRYAPTVPHPRRSRKRRRTALVGAAAAVALAAGGAAFALSPDSANGTTDPRSAAAGSGTASRGSSPLAPASSAAQSAASSGGDAYASAALDTGTNKITAQVYFGQLNVLMGTLEGQSVFNVLPQLLQSDPDVCALTVIFSGANSSSGAVYAQGLDDGWQGDETAPTAHPEYGHLHQQFISPPGSLSAGETWSGSALLTMGQVKLTTSAYTLMFNGQSGTTQRWSFNGQPVACASVA